jgi:hypothetical protein
MSTEQPKPLTGYKESQETKKEIPVDEKRFKEELQKVSESEESQQHRKRNLKKSEEEVDEDELAAKKQQIQASGALFAMFMKESASDDLLTPQTPQNFKASEAPKTTSQFSIEQDNSEPSTKPPSIVTQSSQEPPDLPKQPLTQPPSMPTFSYDQNPEQQPAVASQIDPTYLDQTEPTLLPFSQEPLETPTLQPQSQQEAYRTPVESPKRIEKKEDKDQSLLGKHKPSKAQLQKKEQEKTPEIRLDKPKELPKQAITKKEEPKVAVDKKQESKEPLIFKKQAPLGAKAHQELTSSQIAEKTSPIPLKETFEGQEPQSPAPALEEKKPLISEVQSDDVKTIKPKKLSEDKQPSKDKDKDKEKEDKDLEATLTQPLAPVTFSPPPTPPVPAYANLSPQIFELFEKMVGVMTIQENQGVTTTTVTVNMKNSIFDGAQIILDHYSSAPNAFNVTIAASPEAQAVLTTNIDNLVASFEASKLSFQINLKRPILLEEYQAFKRKEKVGAEPEQEQKQEPE